MYTKSDQNIPWGLKVMGILIYSRTYRRTDSLSNYSADPRVVQYVKINGHSKDKYQNLACWFISFTSLEVTINKPQHEISNNVVYATSKNSDQPAHMRSLIRAFASRSNILWVLNY